MELSRFADELGPYQVLHLHLPRVGGVRMAPDVTTEECFRLARAMTYKNAAAGCTPEAEQALHQRGVLLLPDFIANAGGIICAVTEYHCSPKQERRRRAWRPRQRPARSRRRRGRREWTFAGLLRRTFDFDVFVCVRCGGRRRVLAYMKQAGGVRAILEHLGLPIAGASLAPASGPTQAAGC
jgi:hypothetical protein